LTAERAVGYSPLSSVLDRRPASAATAEVRNRVRDLRAERGLSQGELATAVGVSRQTINSVEQERYTPSLPLALALARYFGTSVEEMFDADQ
jgi:putative transcriptional regulator